MSDDASPAVLICGRVRDRGTVIRGAQQRLCAKCGESVWASKASLAHVFSFAREVEILCVQCAGREIGATIEVQPLSAGQAAEIATELERRGH